MNCRAPAHLCLETPGALEARKGCRAGEGGVARAHSRLGSRSRVTSAPASPNPKLTGTLTAPGTLGPWDPGTLYLPCNTGCLCGLVAESVLANIQLSVGSWAPQTEPHPLPLCLSVHAG